MPRVSPPISNRAPASFAATSICSRRSEMARSPRSPAFPAKGVKKRRVPPPPPRRCRNRAPRPPRHARPCSVSPPTCATGSPSGTKPARSFSPRAQSATGSPKSCAWRTPTPRRRRKAAMRWKKYTVPWQRPGRECQGFVNSSNMLDRGADRRLAGRGCGGLSVDVGRDNSPTNSDCSPPSSLAHQSDDPAPHNRTGTVAGASRRPLIFYSLYFLWPGNGSGQRAPEEDPRIDVEVWALVFELREQELPIAREEAVPVRRRETLLVLGEQRAAHPLHDLLARLHQVTVHDHADVLARVAEPVEPRRVAAGLEQRRAAHVPAEEPPELGRSGELRGGLVRDQIVGHRHLHGDLPARRQRAGEPAQQDRMIREPVQRGVAEDEVELLRRLERRDVLLLEAEARSLRRLRQHGG